MADQTADLSVRRHERRACDCPALLAVAPESCASVRLARSITATDGALGVRVVDFSEGGIGLRSSVFLPVSCRVQVRVALGPAPEAGHIEVAARIQRVAMLDRVPSYYLGASFLDAGEDGGMDLERLSGALQAPRPNGG